MLIQISGSPFAIFPIELTIRNQDEFATFSYTALPFAWYDTDGRTQISDGDFETLTGAAVGTCQLGPRFYPTEEQARGAAVDAIVALYAVWVLTYVPPTP